MELWQVKREYRKLAATMKRRRITEKTMEAEIQLLTALAACDRAETELCVLRLARRCSKARLRRQRAWFESASLVRNSPAHFIKTADDLAAEELERFLHRHQHPQAAFQFRQLLDETVLLDERMQELKSRLGHLSVVASETLQQLAALATAQQTLATQAA